MKKVLLLSWVTLFSKWTDACVSPCVTAMEFILVVSLDPSSLIFHGSLEAEMSRNFLNNYWCSLWHFAESCCKLNSWLAYHWEWFACGGQYLLVIFFLFPAFWSCPAIDFYLYFLNVLRDNPFSAHMLVELMEDVHDFGLEMDPARASYVDPKNCNARIGFMKAFVEKGRRKILNCLISLYQNVEHTLSLFSKRFICLAWSPLGPSHN